MRRASCWILRTFLYSENGKQLDQRAAKEKRMFLKKKAILILMSVPKYDLKNDKRSFDGTEQNVAVNEGCYCCCEKNFAGELLN